MKRLIVHAKRIVFCAGCALVVAKAVYVQGCETYWAFAPYVAIWLVVWALNDITAKMFPLPAREPSPARITVGERA